MVSYLLHRITYWGRKNIKKGFGIAEFQALLTAARNQLTVLIVLI